VQWIEEDGGYPYYVQPVHAKQELKYVWRVLAKQLRCMLYRRHLERTPPSASEPTPLLLRGRNFKKAEPGTSQTAGSWRLYDRRAWL